ncbi:MAG: response regulator [Ardenticatenales bacterium]|nr:response regulator [Ardenticatenales bacterium]
MTTILVVEDDPSLAELLQMVLEEEGYEVRLAGHGKAALRQLGVQPPDLVMSDVMMPHLDGCELYRRMQQAAHLAAIPVILMSAVALRPWETDLVPPTFLPKPFEVEQLLGYVGQLLPSQGRGNENLPVLAMYRNLQDRPCGQPA